MISNETWSWWMKLVDGVLTCSDDRDEIQREALYLAWRDYLRKRLSNKDYLVGELLLEDIRNIGKTDLQSSKGESN